MGCVLVTFRMFETLEHTFTMLCSKSAGVAHTQSLEHHYLVNFGTEIQCVEI